MKKKKFQSFQLYIDKAIKNYKKNTYLINEKNQKNNIKFKDIEIFLINLGIFLKKKKISEQKKILICTNNDNFTGLLLIGLIYFNRIIIPVNPAFKREDIKFIVKNSKPDFIIAEKEYDFLFKKIEIKKSLVKDLNFFKKNIKKKLDKPSINENDFAQIVYTSGSTGSPKGVLLTQKNVISQILSIIKHFNFKSNEKFITILPLFHNGGQFFSTYASLISGSSNLIINPKLAFINFWHYVKKYQINWTLGMGSHINFLINTDKVFNTKLKGFVIGGMRLEHNIQKKFEKKFKIKVLKNYGLTETCSLACSDKPNSKVRKYGASGIPMIGNTIKIFDKYNNILKLNELGEIRVKGNNVFHSYINDKKSTNKCFKNGWFCTGDLGYLDKDNNIYIEDRLDNMIIVSGENIYPSEIEKFLPKLKDLKEGYIIGLIDQIKGNQICLAYKTDFKNEEMLIKKWRKFLINKLPFYKVPSKFINIGSLMTKDFPRLSNGKIDKKRLAILVNSNG
jgi:acyl-CoA synthetase (AMP-forming)/AMP-acid ligase II